MFYVQMYINTSNSCAGILLFDSLVIKLIFIINSTDASGTERLHAALGTHGTKQSSSVKVRNRLLINYME